VRYSYRTMPFDPSAVRSGAVFSTNPTYQAAWICYINGVEVPIMGFDIQYGVWQVPSFTIHLIPDITLQRLGNEDRVPVQIFYLDYWMNPEAPEFRLLIDGEIIGWRYSSAMGQRTMSFSCLAHIHIFQQLYFFYMTNVDDIVAAQSPEVLASGFSTPGLLYPYSLFHQGLLTTSAQVSRSRGPTGVRTTVEGVSTNTAEEAVAAYDPAPAQMIKAPYELMYNVIKGVIAAAPTVPNERRSIPMMNFFARHVRKTRLHNRFVRLPYLEDPAQIGSKKGVFPIFNAARNDEAIYAMQRQTASQVGNSGPVWNVLQQVYSSVLMEIAMIPNPAAVLVELNAAGQDPKDGKIIRILSAETPIEDSGGSLVRVPSREELIAAIRPEDIAELTPDDRAALLAEIEAAPVSGRNVEAVDVVQGVNSKTPIRLAQYFVKPQFLFGVPPHCNVIFPSMVDAWTYDEPYMTQPTRIYVNDSVMTRLLRAEGSNRHFMLHALTVGFPEEADALMQHKVGGDRNETFTEATASMLESGKNLLIWPEEYYTRARLHRSLLCPRGSRCCVNSATAGMTMRRTPRISIPRARRPRICPRNK
jgi:hypothetical protein